jgi:hypothetical protein
VDKLSAAMSYVVNGNKSIETVSIPVGSYVRLVNSAIVGRSDGMYTVKTAIPVDTVIDSSYFNESAPIAGGGLNALNSKFQLFPNYSRTILTKNVQSGSWTATEDCYIIAFVMASVSASFTVNNKSVGIHDDISGIHLTFFSGYLKKGDVIAANSGTNWTAKAFALS